MLDLPEHLEPLTDLIDYLDHVAPGVHDLRAAARLFQLLGGTFITGADNARQGFRWIHYRLPGGAKIEALAPVSDDCFLRRFLQSRGEGVHHLTFKVSSVSDAARRAEGGRALRRSGCLERVIHLSVQRPRDAYPTRRLAREHATPLSLEEVLAGEVGKG